MADGPTPLGTPLNDKQQYQDDCIIYSNASNLVTLIDIPASVSLDVAPSANERLELLSCRPREEPYPSTEPKTATALAKLADREKSMISKDEYEVFISHGLSQIRAHYTGPWCLPRRTPPGDQPQEPHVTASEPTGVPSTISLPAPPQTLTLTPSSLGDSVLHNPHSHPARLRISYTSPCTYLIPPYTTLIPTSLPSLPSPLIALAILSAAPSTTPTAGAGEFDLLLLDPPWPNRSARRASAYRQSTRIGGGSDSGSNAHAFSSAWCGLDGIAAPHVAPHGHVAVWITHARRARQAVLALFENLNVALVEEWVWVKVTAGGEPVVPLGSRWRRGWEVLMIGRRRGDGGRVDGEGVAAGEGRGDGESMVTGEAGAVVRRLVAGVPDLHSRKPCLKALLERDVLRRGDARVLEVFARHLTPGWCVMGDEVLRFNWEGHWIARGEQ